MTNLFFSRKTLILAAFAVLGSLNFAAPQAHAGVAESLRRCEGQSKRAFVNCCDTIIRKQGKPLWFTETRSSCASVVVCTKSKHNQAAATPYRCYFVIPGNDNQGRGPKTQRFQGKGFQGKY